MADESLTVRDNRTGDEVEIPISDGTIHATDLRRLGLMSYDPAFLNTASTRSSITYIDGDAGILRYRGYPIEQLAEQASFLEIVWLLFEGELPTSGQLEAWQDEVRVHTYVHTNVTQFLDGFRHDAHPMGMLLGAIAALSTFYPDAKEIGDEESRRLQRLRLIAKFPTIAAWVFRHSRGLPYVFPRNDLDYIGNFVNMTFEIGGATSRTRCCSGRSRFSSSSTPTTSRTPRRTRCAASGRRRWIRSRRCPPGSPRCTGRCTAARTRRSCGCSTRSARSTACPTSSSA